MNNTVFLIKTKLRICSVTGMFEVVFPTENDAHCISNRTECSYVFSRLLLNASLVKFYVANTSRIRIMLKFYVTNIF